MVPALRAASDDHAAAPDPRPGAGLPVLRRQGGAAVLQGGLTMYSLEYWLMAVQAVYESMDWVAVIVVAIIGTAICDLMTGFLKVLR
jgi:hypothetical protein